MSIAYGQRDQVYKPSANAGKELREAIAKASIENKRVFVDVGGNWCEWCIKFYKFCKTDKEIDSLMKANYIELLVNYSKENENIAVLNRLGNPNKLGFPVFVILDRKGVPIYTQESGSLFGGKDWDREKILAFLRKWSS